MKKIISLLGAAVLLISLCSCKLQKEDLKFYVVGEAQAGTQTNADMLLRTAKKEGRIAFTGQDLEGWLWSEHRVRLKQVNVKGSASDGGSTLFQTKAGDVFLLVLGERVLYTGTFDATSQGVLIQDAGERDFKIFFQNPYGDQKDPRGEERLYNYLVDQQLLVSELK